MAADAGRETGRPSSQAPPTATQLSDWHDKLEAADLAQLGTLWEPLFNIVTELQQRMEAVLARTEMAENEDPLASDKMQQVLAQLGEQIQENCIRFNQGQLDKITEQLVDRLQAYSASLWHGSVEKLVDAAVEKIQADESIRLGQRSIASDAGLHNERRIAALEQCLGIATAPPPQTSADPVSTCKAGTAEHPSSGAEETPNSEAKSPKRTATKQSTVLASIEGRVWELEVTVAKLLAQCRDRPHTGAPPVASSEAITSAPVHETNCPRCPSKNVCTQTNLDGSTQVVNQQTAFTPPQQTPTPTPVAVQGFLGRPSVPGTPALENQQGSPVVASTWPALPPEFDENAPSMVLQPPPSVRPGQQRSVVGVVHTDRSTFPGLQRRDGCPGTAMVQGPVSGTYFKQTGSLNAPPGPPRQVSRCASPLFTTPFPSTIATPTPRTSLGRSLHLQSAQTASTPQLVFAARSQSPPIRARTLKDEHAKTNSAVAHPPASSRVPSTQRCQVAQVQQNFQVLPLRPPPSPMLLPQTPPGQPGIVQQMPPS